MNNAVTDLAREEIGVIEGVWTISWGADFMVGYTWIRPGAGEGATNRNHRIIPAGQMPDFLDLIATHGFKVFHEDGDMTMYKRVI